jgi:hypothetical protein
MRGLYERKNECFQPTKNIDQGIDSVTIEITGSAKFRQIITNDIYRFVLSDEINGGENPEQGSVRISSSLDCTLEADEEEPVLEDEEDFPC